MVTRGVWPFVDPLSDMVATEMDERDAVLSVLNLVVLHLTPYLRIRTRHLMTLREIWADLESLCRPYADQQIRDLRHTLLHPHLSRRDTVSSFCARLRDAYCKLYGLPQCPPEDELRTSLLRSLPMLLQATGQYIMVARLSYLDALRTLEDSARLLSLPGQPEEQEQEEEEDTTPTFSPRETSADNHRQRSERGDGQTGRIPAGVGARSQRTRCAICRRGNHTTDQHGGRPLVSVRCGICRRGNHTTAQHGGSALGTRCAICRRSNHSTDQHASWPRIGFSTENRRSPSRRYGYSLFTHLPMTLLTSDHLHRF